MNLSHENVVDDMNGLRVGADDDGAAGEVEAVDRQFLVGQQVGQLDVVAQRRPQQPHIHSTRLLWSETICE